MGQIQGQGTSDESPLRTSYGRDVCLWPHCVGAEFPEPLWPWPWGRALWMTYSSQSARRQQVEHFSPTCCWQGKSFQAFSRWPLWAMGTLHCQAQWPLFMAHVLEVGFRKSCSCNRNWYSFFCKTGNYLPMWVFLPWLHWQSGSNWSGSIRFLTFIQ